MTDEELLRRYTDHGFEGAFTELVERHLNMVYSVARRHLQAAACAEDVAQTVFIELARKAHRIKPGTPLVAWLHLVSRRCALNAARGELRRRVRETVSAEIATMKTDSSAWAEVEPLIDAAVESLDPADRSAILLRYFENKSLREVGAALGTSEDTAQKRVAGAVEQLRTFFLRSGVTVTASGLVGSLSVHAMQATPTGLSSAIAAGAISGSIVPPAVLFQAGKTAGMTLLQKTLIITTLALAAGSILFATRVFARQQGELEAMRTRAKDSLTQLRRLRDERDAANQKLAAMQVAATARLTSLKGDPAVEAELESWLARVDQLKRRQAQVPGKNIPELRFLTSKDWLYVTMDNRLETEADVGKALSDLRHHAKGKEEVVVNLAHALRDYIEANDNRLPSQLGQLKPYFHTPLPDAILERYELLYSGRAIDVPAGKWVLQEKAVVDDDYDTQLLISKDGSFGFNGFSSLGLAVAQALQEFSKDNRGQRATQPEQLIPYFKTSIDPLKLQNYWSAKGMGKSPSP